MNFSRSAQRDDPEINLIPMIDVLLVILIFLMITTTYSRYSGMEINLPTADAAQNQQEPREINVVVALSGEVLVNKTPVSAPGVAAIAGALQTAAASVKDPIVVISADAKATHQSVIDVMQAAQDSGLAHISFATQQAQ
jgi:biopolymer transport protein ExbD